MKSVSRHSKLRTCTPEGISHHFRQAALRLKTQSQSDRISFQDGILKIEVKPCSVFETVFVSLFWFSPIKIFFKDPAAFFSINNHSWLTLVIELIFLRQFGMIVLACVAALKHRTLIEADHKGIHFFRQNPFFIGLPRKFSLPWNKICTIKAYESGNEYGNDEWRGRIKIFYMENNKKLSRTFRHRGYVPTKVRLLANFINRCKLLD